MDDTAAVVEALRGTSLAGREVLSLTIPTTDQLAYAVPIEIAELRSAWSVMRDCVDALGRWPTATCNWNAISGGSFGDTLGPGEEVSAPGGSAAALAHARRLNGEQVIARWHAWSLARDDYVRREWPAIVERELSLTRDRVQAAPSAERFLDQSFPRDNARLEQELLDWEERQQPTTSAGEGIYLEWFDPLDPCAIVLVPTTSSEDALAYTGGFFGAYGPDGLAGVIAVARHWRTQYGAELVANWGTMLQFHVRQPPTTISDAFTLAHEQRVLAPCTTVAIVSIRDHARALLGRTEWFLHERP